MELSPSSCRPTWVETDLDAITHNVGEFRRALPARVRIMAVVKADAYGHGALELAGPVLKGGADSFAVAFLEEGIELRLAGVKEPVLLIGYTPPEQISQVIAHNLTQTVFSLETARALSREAVSRQVEVPVHIKVDTGMGRVGLAPGETVAFVEEISRLPGIKAEGILTHLASADEEDLGYTYEQVKSFDKTVESLRAKGLDIPVVHAANSAGALNVADSHYNMIRLGLSLYGYYPSIHTRNDVIRLRPAMSFKTRIIYLKKVPPGTFISYGCTYKTDRESVIATIPVGYADGYNRLLSNRGEVLVKGKRAPVVGRVTMDYSMIDVTGIDDIKVYEEVVLYGAMDNDAITVEEVAGKLNTISYELLCAVDKRVSRFYLQGGQIVAFRNLLTRNSELSAG